MALLEDEALVGKVETAFVIGGGQVYKEAVRSERCQAIHLTRIDAEYPCDTYFPNIDQDDNWRLWSSSAPKRESGVRYSFQCYVRNQQPFAGEQQQQEEAASWVPPGIASRHQEYQVRHYTLLPSTPTISGNGVRVPFCLLPLQLPSSWIREDAAKLSLVSLHFP
jgi:hypothetical protein